MDWSNTSNMNGVQHYTIWENCVWEAIHEHHEVAVDHIGDTANPADLFTKEFKANEVYCLLCDLVVSPCMDDGGC